MFYLFARSRKEESDREELQRMYFTVFGICGEEIEWKLIFDEIVARL